MPSSGPGSSGDVRVTETPVGPYGFFLSSTANPGLEVSDLVEGSFEKGEGEGSLLKAKFLSGADPWNDCTCPLGLVTEGQSPSDWSPVPVSGVSRGLMGLYDWGTCPRDPPFTVATPSNKCHRHSVSYVQNGIPCSKVEPVFGPRWGIPSS